MPLKYACTFVVKKSRQLKVNLFIYVKLIFFSLDFFLPIFALLYFIGPYTYFLNLVSIFRVYSMLLYFLSI